MFSSIQKKGIMHINIKHYQFLISMRIYVYIYISSSKLCHELLTSVLMEGGVKFHKSQNTSGALQQSSITAFS